MSKETETSKSLLPNHEQQPLCTTRKPYRQGRKLTAVKAYTIASESNHLLIFGVPSLNLRQETKSLFIKFGKLKQFVLTTAYPTEIFTETYHAVYENIASARIAKKMLDTKNFYGGSLHICYAPELETVEETRYKLFKRHRDVTYRLNYLDNDVKRNVNDDIPSNVNDQNEIGTNMNKEKSAENTKTVKQRLNMGEINTISIGKQIRDVVFNKGKRKHKTSSPVVIEKQFNPCFIQNEVENALETYISSGERHTTSKTTDYDKNSDTSWNITAGTSRIKDYDENSDTSWNTPCTSKSKDICQKSEDINNGSQYKHKKFKSANNFDNLEIVDFTSTEKETLSNINEALNYNKFGNEVIREVKRPVNKIIFCLNSNKKLI